MANYENTATRHTPALIIYVLDISGSMGAEKLDGQPRINLLQKALDASVERMVMRSMRGSILSPRYCVAIFAYNESVYDVVGGVQSIKDLPIPLPDLTKSASGGTHTKEALEEARSVLLHEVPKMGADWPAPLVCHITDGVYTSDDPHPVAAAIKSISTPDGNVLFENVMVSDKLLRNRIQDVRMWPGVQPVDLSDPYAETLMKMSSPLPDSYAKVIRDEGFSMQAGIPMMIPAESDSLVQLAFVMSAASKTSNTPNSANH